MFMHYNIMVLLFYYHVEFMSNHRSVGYGKQFLLVLSCVEERGWSRLEKSIRL